jgi:hypothetical protein
MRRILRRRVALTVALAAVLAGGTAVALGATGGDAGHDHRAGLHGGSAAHGHHGGVLHVAASYLGLSPRELRDQLRSGKSLAQVANSTPGKSEAGLVAALLAAAKARFAAGTSDREARIQGLVNRTPGASGPRHRHGAHRAAVRSTVLSYLGIRGHEVARQLRAGKTFAQIADATPGKSAAGLGEALEKALTVKLNAAAAAKQLDQDAQAVRFARMRERVSRLLNRSHRGPQRAAAAGSAAPSSPSG